MSGEIVAATLPAVGGGLAMRRFDASWSALRQRWSTIDGGAEVETVERVELAELGDLLAAGVEGVYVRAQVTVPDLVDPELVSVVTVFVPVDVEPAAEAIGWLRGLSAARLRRLFG